MARKLQTILKFRFRRRRSGGLRLVAALGALCMPILLGCTDTNPNLGATPTATSSISFISPSSKAAGGPAFQLQVDGSSFTTTSIVTWNNGNQSTSLSTGYVNSSQLVANVPSSLLAVPGTYSIGVISPQTGGNQNEGNNISNFLPFCVTSASNLDCSSTANDRSSVSGDGVDSQPAISAGPRYVAFVAASANGSGAANGVNEIFLRDTCEGAPQGCMPQTTLVSVTLDGSEPNGSSRSPSISSDGRFVAFVSDASNLVPSDDNAAADVFLRDTCTGAPQNSGCIPGTTRISLGPGGAEANGASASPSISPDGRFVAFESAATNLVAGSPIPLPGAAAGTFLRDTCFGATGACTPSTTVLTITSSTAAQ